jgi:hypothetical protein
VGEVPELPTELRWESVAGAARYRVRVLSADDTVLWEGSTTSPSATLPADLLSRLHRAVSYQWRVDASGADGTLLGSSATTRFRVRPAPESRRVPGDTP